MSTLNGKRLSRNVIALVVAFCTLTSPAFAGSVSASITKLDPGLEELHVASVAVPEFAHSAIILNALHSNIIPKGRIVPGTETQVPPEREDVVNVVTAHASGLRSGVGGYAMRVEATAESRTNWLTLSALARAEVSVTDEITLTGSDLAFEKLRASEAGFDSRNIRLVYNLSGTFVRQLTPGDGLTQLGIPDFGGASVLFAFSSPQLALAYGSEGLITGPNSAVYDRNDSNFGSGAGFGFELRPIAETGMNPGDSSPPSRTYAYSTYVRTTAEARGGKMEARFGNSVVLESIIFADGSTPESYGLSFSSSLGYSSPNIVPEPTGFAAIALCVAAARQQTKRRRAPSLGPGR
jgi:hypothetical protein